mmetsp:Transcript_5889/g.12729  ORF Transcript_5889/g.12729 Transcript_5889/m.12729 type:complete len:135 (-) Transcript_5889:951-1355(-)
MNSTRWPHTQRHHGAMAAPCQRRKTWMRSAVGAELLLDVESGCLRSDRPLIPQCLEPKCGDPNRSTTFHAGQNETLDRCCYPEPAAMGELTQPEQQPWKELVGKPTELHSDLAGNTAGSCVPSDELPDAALISG